MPNRLDETRLRLLSRGLPLGYVDRLIGELRDHMEDAAEANRDAGMESAAAWRRAEVGLGEPADLAAGAARMYRGRTLLGRQPVAAGLTIALIGVPLTWAGFLAVTLGGGLALFAEMGVADTSSLAAVFMRAACHLASYWVCAALAACAYVAMRRTAVGAAVTWATCALVALVGSFNAVSVTPPAAQLSNGRLVVGVSPVPDPWKTLPPAAAVLMCDAAWRRGRRRARMAIC